MEQSQSMRSDIYLLLANLFRQAPSQELLGFLTQLEFENNGTPMAAAWESVINESNDADTETLADEYQELFIGIGRGEVVPFASWHITGSLMEKPLADIRTDLAQLGLERSESVKEPEDHIAALCEIMSYLCEGEEAQQKVFFNRHISPWFERLIDQITSAPSAKFYLAVAQLLGAFLTLENVSFTEAKSSKRNTHKIEVKNLSN